MTRYSFVGQVVLNPDGSIGGSLPGTAWTADIGGTDVTSDLKATDGVTSANFATNAQGVPPHIYGPDNVTTLWYSFAGGPRFPVSGTDVTEHLLQDYIFGRIAGSSGGSGIAGAPASWPQTFPPSAHSHPSSDISDSSAVGRQVLTAPDQQAARAAIAAASSSTVSFPGFGTTATTAAQGSHSHTAIQVGLTPVTGVTATNVQDAIAQLAATGGGGGGAASAVYVWRYSAGGWPAVPSTKPAGAYMVQAIGPTYPTTIPSWCGLGATQIPLAYSKLAVL